MLIRGRCHCGNISFALTWEPDPPEIQARACTCSFCTKHGAVWTTNPSGTLKISIREPERVAHYAFATNTAQFHICAQCGVVPVVTSRIDDRLYAVVNVNTFEGVEPSLLRPVSVSFDGESEEIRSARRKRYWIDNVEYTESGAQP